MNLQPSLRGEKKQVLDNLKAEIELLQPRHENQEGRYQEIDEKKNESRNQ